MKFALAALPLLAVTIYAADLTSCQEKCVASNLCSGTTDYLTSSCICSDDFQQNVKVCLYTAGGGCGNDVGSWFDYAEAACAAAAASSGAGSGSAAAETGSGSGSGSSKADPTATGSSGSSGHGSSGGSATGSSAAAAISQAKASGGSSGSTSGSSSGAGVVAQVPLALGALGVVGALLL